MCKLADLVVVKGNPLTDIRNTHNVRMVFKAGRAYDPAELFKSVVRVPPPVLRF